MVLAKILGNGLALLGGCQGTREQALRLRQATTYATRVAADATRFAYTWAGSDGLRNPSVMTDRCAARALPVRR